MERIRYSVFSTSSQPWLDVLRLAFEAAGVEFIGANGGRPGVRLRKRQRLSELEGIENVNTQVIDVGGVACH